MKQYKKILSELFKQKDFPENTKNSIANLIGSKKIILYGAGSGFFTFSVFVLQKYGLKVSSILDRKLKSGTKFHEINAYSPHDYKPTTEDKNKTIVIITVGKKIYHEEIFNTIQQIGFRNIILATDLYEYHLHHPEEKLEENGFSYFLQNKTQILKCLNIFADDLSREVYTKFIQTHMLKKLTPIPHRPLEEQYFPKDIKLTKKNYSRFINCGAYQGETISECNKLHGKLEAVAFFEPDLNNFALLNEYVSSNYQKIAKSIIAYPCGVFDHEAQLRFFKDNGTNSMISEKGDSIIQCVALDHVIPNFKPTFISMDIEGAELEALRGALNLIKKNKPTLAISAYHRPNHIWDIPLFIDSLKLGYKFYLRNYTSFISETILYAIMKN